ncbi:hypothetical protein G6F46_010141 [Rhizopus delemar]|uniref:BHLH domain-containing protein n=3 Tax=Rhizopus TaxID=4842 RepID=I1BPC8_RHIO9|nr:hypothetical protein RO3G_02762 [Rhizopus delemar RA 99-880]KAG1054236.1 hypothetical protein G6F43_003746 [Rhizopus delemar]KAG1537747.1 hypothetical protein G6F51_010184 [Rhizopus arrhizus]KAG1452080.1 hypothetical protein G6F55_008867 [Rhizopus delemar]KAG1490350.1 hypothetical protein G6F54_010788 [Rhizopus delemar]|eukprot:EIE78058.1 hypothetical protein RO3G_02762 [Rhizopus delemar RA 99-880]
MNKIQWSTAEYLNEYPQQSYPTTPTNKLDQSSLMYPVSPFYASTVATSPSASPLSASSGLMYGSEPFVASSPPPFSPDSLMSGFASAPIYQAPPLVQSSSTSTMSSTSSAYLSETIAKASALPESFYPEFLQYSKESFEQGVGTRKQVASQNKKRAREEDKVKDEGDKRSRKQKTDQDITDTNVSELRRQIHIQSEQKRRAQIKDGFEDLRNELPACLNKKMSKVTLLHRTVQHIQHLKSTQMTILAELERLVQENEQLRSFQQSVLQKQALENMYSI